MRVRAAGSQVPCSHLAGTPGIRTPDPASWSPHTDLDHVMRASHLLFVVALAVGITATPIAQLRMAPVAERPDLGALELDLRKLGSTATFMQTAAHPDDEDNALLAMLGEGQGMRTVLVTATRGNGGQNEIGPELFEPLGVLRTEELLAVHRFDGAEQYFTRAIDFGYSFSIEESIEKWGHDEILGDFVRMIRTVRPDVIAGFFCGGEGGGQHHQASARLTVEAFRAAADPARYPEQIAEGLRPWQALRVFCTEGLNLPAPKRGSPDLLTTNLSGFDPALGRTYAALGLEARSMHKCQGTSQQLLLPGEPSNRTYTYRLRDSTIDPEKAAPRTFFEGIDVTLVGLGRFAGDRKPADLLTRLTAISKTIVDAQQAFGSNGPSATLPALTTGLRGVRDLRVALGTLGLGDSARFEVDFRLAQKERQFQDALLAAAGIRLDALSDDGVVTPGQSVNVSVYAASSASDGSVVQSVTLTGFDGAGSMSCQGPLASATPVTCRVSAKIPANTHDSTPYWKPRKDAARYDFESDVPFGVPFRPSPFHAVYDLTIGGQRVTSDRPVEFRYDEVVAGEKRTDLKVVPPFNVRVTPDIVVVPALSTAGREIRVTVSNNEKAAASGNVALQVPAGWTSEPASAPVRFAREDEEATVRFSLSPRSSVATGESIVTATVTAADGATSSRGYEVIEYPHIHRQHYVESAATRVKVIDVAIAHDMHVGYVMGVGDEVPQAISQLGAHVELIDADTLAFGDLSKYDVIVTGVRAYERRPDLRANNRRLIQYAENGGTVLVQYNKFEFNEAQYGPYPAKVSSNRVTDENAPVQVLVPDHPVFNRPNKIGPDSWANWVQERGLYFLGERDPRYVDLVRTQDPFPLNASPQTGALVEAKVGKGRWIYIGLGLWRQLPAGTDGAYRLLANLLSLGKH
jgi:LmbE family N-acetylglucosaminyl deacetylase